MQLSLAPLQGFTEFPYRNALNAIIGGVDKFYTPYLKFENDGSLRQKYIKDILPGNNKNIVLIPQVLINNSTQFIKLHDIIKNFGYSEININLGCPYPMVANKKLGSGLLPFRELLERLFDEIFSKTELKVSIKFRSGYQHSTEINELISLFNKYPFNELIYHPRIGKQLYKGEANLEDFNRINSLLNQQPAYNGDIHSIEKYKNISSVITCNQHFMLGRGLLINPFLAHEIKNGPIEAITKKELFFELHQYLFNHYKNTLSGDSHLLNKMIHFWEYFSHLFENQHKVHKLFKKCKNLANYELHIKELNKHYSIKEN